MSSNQVSAGLAAVFAASTMLGKSGAVALLITLFMAVVSCDSAELIAVSSILKFNIYKIYTKPPASPESLVKVAHINVGIFGLTMAIFHHWYAKSMLLLQPTLAVQNMLTRRRGKAERSCDPNGVLTKCENEIPLTQMPESSLYDFLNVLLCS